MKTTLLKQPPAASPVTEVHMGQQRDDAVKSTPGTNSHTAAGMAAANHEASDSMCLGNLRYRESPLRRSELDIPVSIP